MTPPPRRPEEPLRLFGYGPEHAPPDAVRAALVRHGFARGGCRALPAWCLDEGAVWREADGDRMPKGEHDLVVESRDVAGGDWMSLPWHGTALLDPEYATGWLSPDGEWCGCGPVWHDRAAWLAFGVPPEELHRTHVRMREGGHASPPTGAPLTPEQSTWLRKRRVAVAMAAWSRAEDLAAWERAEKARWADASGRPLRRGRDGD